MVKYPKIKFISASVTRPTTNTRKPQPANLVFLSYFFFFFLLMIAPLFRMRRFQLRISYLSSLLLSSHPVSLQIHLKLPSFFFPLLPSSLPSIQASLRASSSGTIESVHGGYLGLLTPAQIVPLEPSLMLTLASPIYPVVHPFPPDQLPPQLSVFSCS